MYGPTLVLIASACGETNNGQPPVTDTTGTSSATTSVAPNTTGSTGPAVTPPTSSGPQTGPASSSTTGPQSVVPGSSSSAEPSTSSQPTTSTGPASSSGQTTSSTAEPEPSSGPGESSGPITETPPPSGVCPPNPGSAPTGTLNATALDITRSDPNAFILFEGPAWVDGALYFSEVNPNPWDSDIRKYVPGASDAEVFLENAGTNGLAVDASGVLFSATARKKEISRYDLSAKTQTTAVSGMFNSPNDIAIASDGTIYFSDQQQGELPAGGQPQVVHIVKDGQDAVFHPDIQPPNGVLLSPEEDVLYVTVTGNGVIKKVTLNADGTANVVSDFATGLQTPDGMTKDCLGNVYVAEHNAQQVTVFSPDGAEIAAIKTGMANNQSANPTNVAFGGADGKTLFITASYSVWQVELPVSGYPY
jgi:sugar lactone lactonase YvrE